MFVFGTSLIGVAILLAYASTICFALVPSGHVGLLRWGRATAWGTLFCATACAGLLLALFLARRYDVAYVYDHSSEALELGYRVAAAWTGPSGVLIIWTLTGLICATRLMRRTRELEPYILAVLMLVQTLLLILLFVRNPFL